MTTTDIFYWPVRVYYEDTDAAGVVYYANYLKFFERARTEWLRARGFEQDMMREAHGVVFVVSRLQVDYQRPAKFNDALRVSCEMRKCGAASMSFHQVAERTSDQIPLSQATVQIVCVDADSFKPTPIPNAMRSYFL
ncbi:MAG: tol-pal system-associated acyl-CoA thioesterase [Halothiobacillus sp. 13-55-253]|nr:MAG: tol-pal system-associated acyl-CoA thioesterase [Halothiobacillus sp. 13-55-253]